MARLSEDRKTVVEAEPGAVRVYRVVVDLGDEPRGREPTAAEMAAPRDSGGPPPRNWDVRASPSGAWVPMSRRGPSRD